MGLVALKSKSRQIGLLLISIATLLPAAVSLFQPASKMVLQSGKGYVERKMNILKITSPGGIEAWLVEDHTVPLVAIRFAFQGGNNQNPPGKEGTANFLSAMLDEGAGDMNAQAFQERMEELAVQMGFEDGADAFYGHFTTLTENREAGVEMLRLALTKPRFDADAVERMRKQLLTNIAFAERDPARVANKTWDAIAFPAHPYGKPASGTPKSVRSITSDDLESYRRRIFARAGLKVSAVGDINATELGALLDKAFGTLPEKPELLPVKNVTPKAGGTLKITEMDVPQSVAKFGFGGITRRDPDFISGFVLNHIIGGGGFSSRLMAEVREKRGLAYSVYSYLEPMKYGAVMAGSVATKNEEIGQSLEVIKSELDRIAKDGPSTKELDDAKSYLTGSYALGFDTSTKIARQLLGIQMEELGIDYVNRRNKLVDAVSIEDVKRVAKRLIKTDDLIIVIVGKPKNLKSRS